MRWKLRDAGSPATYVRPTLESNLIELPAYLRTRKDPETGLALIDLERS